MKTITAFPDHETCLQCNGSGKIWLRPNSNTPFIDCDICKGTGKAEWHLLWIIQGAKLLEWRLKQNLGLREAARKYNLDPSNLSKMERGVMKPNDEYLKMTIGY